MSHDDEPPPRHEGTGLGGFLAIVAVILVVAFVAVVAWFATLDI